MSRRHDRCVEELRQATDYPTWLQAASELDRIEEGDSWKAQDDSDLYDWRLIRSRLRHIRQFRAEGAMQKLVHHLRQGLHWNLGNIGNPLLYSFCHVGTKYLIRDYIEEVADALDYICNTRIDGFDPLAKVQFFRNTAHSFGRSALMLSGGATLGLFHVGVVKALYREDLLPEVISGSSAGAVVAATVCTRRPDEVEELLDTANAYYHFWRPLRVRQIIQRRAVMDQVQLRRAIAKNVRDMTFDEAARLSGRILNITVSPAARNQPPRLLNYLTFPYLFLREAVLASCAVPLMFPPVMLMTRDELGQRVPYAPTLRWMDGSLKSDLPTLRLRRLHNVNHFVVSQTNPHVLPFMRKREREGLVASVRDYAYAMARSQVRDFLNFGRLYAPVGIKPTLETATSILDQDYSGHVTIMPDISLWRYMRVAANPDLRSVERFILEGERATWPRLAMVRNQTLIAQTLARCLRQCEQDLQNVDRPARDPVSGRPGLRVVRKNSG